MNYKNIIFNILLCFIHQAELINEKTNHTYSIDAEIRKTLNLLDQGIKTIELNQQYKKMTLVMGVTGTGKSTFIQWLAGDNNKLISTEVNEGTGEYIIVDNHRISNSTIESKTIFPELIVDPITNATYYDCPGFSDTRSPSNDIATTFFIKTLIDYAENVKLIFSIHYASVTEGGNRQDFTDLIRHATDLIKDIDKYQESIALIVTKVDNRSIKKRGRHLAVPDTKIIETIAKFIKTVEDDLKKRLLKAPQEKKEYYKEGLKFVQILLSEHRGRYTRIGIFRRPDEPGPLRNIKLLQIGKNHIKNIIFENLRFTRINRNDFGYTISADSKNYIYDIVENINNKISSDIANILFKKIQMYYENSVNAMRMKIISLTKGIYTIRVDHEEANCFINDISEGFNVFNNLSEEVKSISTITLVDKISNSIRILGINGIEEELKNIDNRKKHLEFFQAVSNIDFRSRSWNSLTQSIAIYLTNSKIEIEKDIDDATEKIDDKIKSIIESIAEEMLNSYKNKISSSVISKLPDEIKIEHDLCLNMIGQISYLDSAQVLSRKINDFTMLLDVDKSNIETLTTKVYKMGQYLTFLQIMSDKKLKIWSPKWISTLSTIEKYLSESKIWYVFLNSFLETFSQYAILKNKNKYNVGNIQDWGLENKLQGISINRNNLKLFLEKIKPFDIIESDAIEHMHINEVHMEELKTVLSLTINDVITHICQSDKLIIIGRNIKLSDVNTKIRECPTKKYIIIYALKQIFIDEDMYTGGDEINLVIFSPRWEVIENITINISGSIGLPHKPLTANDGKFYEADGDHGKPGLPGGHSGNFLGIGAEFINDHLLTIIANGGVGGAGQNGGNGASGRQGEDAPTDMNYYGCSGMCTNQYKFKCKCGINDNTDTIIEIPMRLISLIKLDACLFYGKGGTKGGNGGNGGQGGHGGTAGHIDIISLTGYSNIFTVNNNGNTGISGRGGIGGPSGKSENLVHVSCYKSFLAFFLDEPKKFMSIWKNGEYFSSENGIDGFNNIGIKPPIPKSAVNNVAELLNNYKSYLIESLHVYGSYFIKESLYNFINQLHTSNKVKKYSDTEGLYYELMDLEKHYHKLNKLDLLPFYQSLLERIVDYSQNLKDGEKSNHYKNSLIYLYTATLSKIYDINSGTDLTMIIDVAKYLDLLQSNIKTLSILREKQNKYDIINKSTKSYMKSITDKVDETNSLISEEIIPAVNQIIKQMDNNIDLLIEETTENLRFAEIHVDDLIERKKKLSNALIFRGIFSALKILGGVISFIGPIGAAAGAVVGAGSSIAESLVLDDDTSQKQPLSLPPGIYTSVLILETDINNVKNMRIANYNTNLDRITQEVSEHSELHDISNKVNDIRKLVNKMDHKNWEEKKLIKNIKKLDDELMNDLEAKEKELTNQSKHKENEIKTQKTTYEKRISSVMMTLGKVRQIVQLGTIGFDIYSRHSGDKAKINEIADAISQAKNEIQKIEEYQQKIYSDIVPSLKMIKNVLKESQENFGNKSQVGIDLSKWKVQAILRDYKSRMLQLTKGFKIEADMARCIEKLDETMTTQINMYNRIQDYKQQQNLASYIAAISKPNSWHQEIQDKLEFLIRSNLIHTQRDRAFDAVKQWVFPFADLYFKKITSSVVEFNNTNIEDIASEAIIKLDLLKSTIDTYKSSIQRHDAYINYALFDSGYISSHSFFIWKNEEYNDAINKLLSGMPIVLKADVTTSPPDKDAIKFKFIEVKLKTNNETLQRDIDKKLIGFKIRATHMGNSYYRFDNKYYVISGDSQTIEYAYEKSSSGFPIDVNAVYNKIKEGDLMLSPYAMWKFELIQLTDRIPFSELLMYKNYVDIELVGSGIYARKDSSVAEMRMDLYYKSFDVMKNL